MEKRKVRKDVTEYVEKCTYCDKEIIGSTETQVLYNLSIHINAKHGKDKK